MYLNYYLNMDIRVIHRILGPHLYSKHQSLYSFELILRLMAVRLPDNLKTLHLFPIRNNFFLIDRQRIQKYSIQLFLE